MKKREKKKREARPRSDGKGTARALDALTAVCAAAMVLVPWAVCALYGVSGWTAAAIFPSWGKAWRSLETAIPTLTALLQCACVIAALRAGRAACRSRKEPEREMAKLNWCAVWALLAGGLFMVGTGWDTAFTRSPWALLGLARTAAAVLAAALVRRYRKRIAEACRVGAEESVDKAGEIE